MNTTQETFSGKVRRIVKNDGIGGLLKKGTLAALRPLEPLRIVFYPYARWKVPQAARKHYTAETAVDFVLGTSGGYIKPSQVRWEIVSLAKIVETLKPKTVLEIGTSRGGTLFVWARLATKDAKIVSIDLPGGENDWAYPRWKEPFYRTFASKGQTIDLIRGDSHSEATVAELKRALGDDKVDFLFIDGDHTYDGVKKDYELYAPFVRPGGVIGFHDVALHPPITRSEVHVLWNEIKRTKRSQEFIEDQKQGWGGIGVLFV